MILYLDYWAFRVAVYNWVVQFTPKWYPISYKENEVSDFLNILDVEWCWEEWKKFIINMSERLKSMIINAKQLFEIALAYPDKNVQEDVIRLDMNWEWILYDTKEKWTNEKLKD